MKIWEKSASGTENGVCKDLKVGISLRYAVVAYRRLVWRVTLSEVGLEKWPRARHEGL